MATRYEILGPRRFFENCSCSSLNCRIFEVLSKQTVTRCMLKVTEMFQEKFKNHPNISLIGGCKEKSSISVSVLSYSASPMSDSSVSCSASSSSTSSFRVLIGLPSQYPEFTAVEVLLILLAVLA